MGFTAMFFGRALSSAGRNARLGLLASGATAATAVGCFGSACQLEPNPFSAAGGTHEPFGRSDSAGGVIQQQNRVLSPKHRVILGEWPIISAVGANDARTATLEALFEYCAEAGYDGVEIGPSMSEFTPWFPVGTPHAERVRRVRALAARTGVPVVGATYCVGGRNEDVAKGYHNLDFAEPNFLERLRQRLRRDKEFGVEYASFQIHLPEEHQSTGGEYREDKAFLQLSAERIAHMQRICFEEGLNFYVETHVMKISEDITAFVKIMDLSPYFEVNGDLSHYIFRGISKGSGLERVLGRVGHMHQRMARAFGDLSSDVPDPVADWEGSCGDAQALGGVEFSATRLAWEMAARAFQARKPTGYGLSSRAIMGETGEMCLVPGSRCLDLDRSLIPLYRKMAAYADRYA